MPKCKNCGEEITKFDKDICPYCGFKKPFDSNEYKTIDVTQTIEVIKDDDKYNFKIKKRFIAFLLSFFLGVFGSDCYYLGFVKEGLYKFLISAVIFSVISLPLFFYTELSYYAFVVGGGVIFILSMLLSFVYIFSDTIKDKKGAFLK